MNTAAALAASARPLLDEHDALLVDLDGVVQLDDEPVTGAPQALARARARGLRVAFMTNNAARPPQDVADRLRRLGVDADPSEVVTSAMAAADLLGTRLPAGAAVLVVGGVGLVDAVSAAGLRPVDHDDAAVAAVVQGWGPDVGWRLLAEGAVALRRGVSWVATNADRTLPSPRGPLPGNGSLVAALTTATGRAPEVVGKPERALFDAAARRAGGDAPLVVGDRLDTDIAGARAAGLPALLVLTGVAGAADVLGADATARPTYLGMDLGALSEAHPSPRVEGAVAHCAEVTVTADGVVHRDNGERGDPLDVLRAACALAWNGLLPPDRYDDVLAAMSAAG